MNFLPGGRRIQTVAHLGVSTRLPVPGFALPLVGPNRLGGPFDHGALLPAVFTFPVRNRNVRQSVYKRNPLRGTGDNLLSLTEGQSSAERDSASAPSMKAGEKKHTAAGSFRSNTLKQSDKRTPQHH